MRPKIIFTMINSAVLHEKLLYKKYEMGRGLLKSTNATKWGGNLRMAVNEKSPMPSSLILYYNPSCQKSIFILDLIYMY